MKTNKLSILLLFVFFSLAGFAQIKLPKLISDGMVLQRNVPLKIWGWASPNEKITIEFNKKTYKTSANNAGEWFALLPKMKESGSSYTMTLKASNEIVLKNILVGDVWLASGQSNMDLTMTRVKPLYETEIANSSNSNIRFFTVKQVWDLSAPNPDFASGEWKEANPANLLNFSAVAYFFAKETYEKYKIPIGIVHSSQGGSPIQAWISESALKPFPNEYNEALKFKDTSLVKNIVKEENAKTDDWNKRLLQADEGYKNKQQTWSDTSLNTSDWKKITIPGYYVANNMANVIGAVWFRKEIFLPASCAGKPAKLNVGTLKDADITYWNGVQVGSTSYQYPPRRYEVPANVLKAGRNILVVRLVNNSFNGGFIPDKPYQLTVGSETFDLKGEWIYKQAAQIEPAPSQTTFRNKPTALFNAMLHPIINYRIKGALWYQGESNAGNPNGYDKFLASLISDWRNRWQEGEFPFLIVQLANYMEAKKTPTESGWAELREIQRKTTQSIPNTGLAVTIDLGEWNDIHPLNKKDVGKRLSLLAQKIAYNEKNTVATGPLYQSMQKDGNKIILTFTETGSGLISKDGNELKQFAIAGADNKYVWAKAKIENNKVIVWSDEIANPENVRYAWADNPEGANLYNKEGLPASPFTTK